MRWLSVDPGDMTGWALWEDARLVEAGQTRNWNFVDDVADALNIGELGWTGNDWPTGPFAGIRRIVAEDFLLYPWIIAEGGLDFDPVETARILGALQLLARLTGTEFVLQGADIKDQAEAGGAKELFYHPLHEMRHANDGIRHGWYYIQTVLLKPGVNARVERGRLVPNEASH